MLIRLLFVVAESIWRRAFGCDAWGLPILKHRSVLHIINVILTGGVLWYIGLSWWQNAITLVLWEGLYWTRAHGPGFDAARSGKPTPELEERYKKEFWDKWCKFLTPEQAWYGLFYDFLWMMFRYGIYSIPIAIVTLNPFFLLAGVCVSFTYFLCHSLAEHKLLKKLGATQLAEVVSGGVSALLLTL